MRFVKLTGPEAAEVLERSISGLRLARPSMSAGRVLTPRQRNVLLGVLVCLGAIAIFQLRNTVIAVVCLVTALYLAMTLNRVVLFLAARKAGNVEVVSDEEACAVPDGDLPRYTVLVPAYREPEVIGRLITCLDRLDYPADRLDIKILLEEDDAATIDAVRQAEAGEQFSVVLIPAAEPRTKPKALNYALHLAEGELVCIYDAEDDPEPLQLRRAAVALARLPPSVACLQAQLSFANVEQNLITKWFTIEYSMWFTLFLPGLVETGAPLPLGGTSNHFRRAALQELGAWDAHNVTEDADLGIRMARLGYHCGVLQSTTLEEANSDFVNWVKQRSRWYKGYLQTVLIHLRHPLETRRQIGTKGFVQFVLFVGGTPLLSVLNPIFWLTTAMWFLGHPHVIKALYPAPVFYVATVSWVFGNFLVAYLTLLTCRLNRRPELVVAAVLVPIYWVMMAVAAIKACYQLVASPSFWEKTTHGLDGRSDVPPIDLRDGVVSPAARRSAPTA